MHAHSTDCEALDEICRFSLAYSQSKIKMLLLLAVYIRYEILSVNRCRGPVLPQSEFLLYYLVLPQSGTCDTHMI